jgi:hypothetical protein
MCVVKARLGVLTAIWRSWGVKLQELKSGVTHRTSYVRRPPRMESIA